MILPNCQHIFVYLRNLLINISLQRGIFLLQDLIVVLQLINLSILVADLGVELGDF